jgi:hypothetical protein
MRITDTAVAALAIGKSVSSISIVVSDAVVLVNIFASSFVSTVWLDVWVMGRGRGLERNARIFEAKLTFT